MDLTQTSSLNNTLDLQLQPPHTVVSYKECLKNHAANIGGRALDGCGEFMPSVTPTTAAALKCAACGCHRNFHRRDNHHNHHQLLLLPPPPPPKQPTSQNSTPSQSSGGDPSSPHHHNQPPSPVPYSYYASAPNMLLALNTRYSDQTQNHNQSEHEQSHVIKKRSRTKFSEEQKQKMWAFAEKIGWTMQRSDAQLIEQCCCEAGVCREVFKVWMHNHKKRNPDQNHNQANTFVDKIENGCHNLNVSVNGGS